MRPTPLRPVGELNGALLSSDSLGVSSLSEKRSWEPLG